MPENISKYSGPQTQEALNIIENLSVPQINQITTSYNNNNIKYNNLILSYNNKINELFNLIYPIGSIITTDPSKDPNTFTPFKWEKINLNATIDANDYFNAWFKTKGLTLETDSNGKKWFLIYNHNSNSGSNLFNLHNSIGCQSNNMWNQLWMLMEDTKIFLNGNKYEFKLTYPDYSSTAMNHWTQTSNPLYFINAVTGYSGISISWPTEWGGLALYDGLLDEASGTYCLLASCIGTSSWWYAIAPFARYYGGVPGPRDGDVVITGRTQLRIRVPGCENINVSTLTNNIYWKRIS